MLQVSVRPDDGVQVLGRLPRQPRSVLGPASHAGSSHVASENAHPLQIVGFNLDTALAVMTTDTLCTSLLRCQMCSCLLWRQVELEDALHWLSTLGGAYSNLGEHSTTFVCFC